MNAIHAKINKILESAGKFYVEPVYTNALAASSTSIVSFTNQDKLPFLIQKIAVYGYDTVAGIQTKNFSLNFKDQARQQLLMSGDVHGSAFGTGKYQPTILPVPYLVRGASTFQVTIKNLLPANAINVNVAFLGYKIKDIKRVDEIKALIATMGSIYIEPVTSMNLLAGQTIKQAFTNADDIPFFVQKIVVYGQNHGTLAETNDYRLNFKDSASMDLLMGDSVYGNSFGSGDFPTIMSVPFMIRGNGSLEVDFASVSASAQDIYLSFIGFKPNFAK